MTSKYISLVLACCIAMEIAWGQYVSTDNKRLGDRFYARGDYYTAAKYYEKALAKENGGGYEPYLMQQRGMMKQAGTRPGLLYKLAESCRLINDYAHAESWYKMVLEEDPSSYPLARLWYGISCRANGKYPEARQALQKFLDQYKTKDGYHVQAQRELAVCEFIQEQLAAAAGNYTVEKFSLPVNKEGGNYAATWLSDDSLLFTSTRSQEKNKNGKPSYINALYTASAATEATTEAAPFILPVDESIKGMDKGVAALSADGQDLYLTIWSVNENGKKLSAIYVSHRQHQSWSKPEKLPATINVEGYSARQPHLTPDGKYFYFASDRPGGKGGMDIWFAPVNSNRTIGKPVNAGPVINTKDNEEAPFYHMPTGTLVFATNGRIGMGGYDLFSSTGSGQNWDSVHHLGYPVNSIRDDIYFVSRGKVLLDRALLSSDRSSLCCLELYAINAKPVVAHDTISIAPVETVKVPDIFEGKTELVTHDILFAYNLSDLDDKSYEYLDKVAAYLKENTGVRIEIGAHTDGMGSAAYNLLLSEKRAKAVAAYLVKAGIAKERLISKGYGESHPVEKETGAGGKDKPAAREKNRRVEIKIIQ